MTTPSANAAIDAMTTPSANAAIDAMTTPSANTVGNEGQLGVGWYKRRGGVAWPVHR